MKKWPFFQTSRKPIRKSRQVLKELNAQRHCRPRFQPILEQLEDRVLFTTNVTTFHYDYQATGANLTETQLTPANVNQASFGQLFTKGVDGQVYAQPLVLTNVNITGANAGTYPSVVFVATENDSLYAINAGTGATLWQRSFLDITNSNDFLPGASSVTTVPSGDTGATSIQPTIGITGTPVIDPATNTLYVETATKETVGSTIYYVQRLHAISCADGSDRVASFLIGTTTAGNTNATPIFVTGTGDGSVGGVVKFNALREFNRPALSLVNGTVYIAWASHGDIRPYHGWVAAWNVSNLQTNGMVLAGVLNTDPNGNEAGIWEGGGGLSFEPDGSAFYFETGNGFGRSGNPTLDAIGFPTDRNFYESLVKVVADPSTSAANQNANGWGLKISDYFTPYNVAALDAGDTDFGSSSPLVLPNSAGIPNHPHLMIAAGKEGKIYLIDRDNLGKFNPNGDNVINAVANGTGQTTPPVLINGSLSAPAYFQGEIYEVSGYTNNAKAILIGADGTLLPTSQTANGNFGFEPGSIVVTANGNHDGIVWIMDRNATEIHAYSALNLNTEFWNSNDKPGDALDSVVKFATPTVANGQVFVGTGTSLTVFGLKGPGIPAQAPNVPANLSAQTLSGSAVELNWTDNTPSPNFAISYLIQDSTDGVHFATVATAGQQATAYTVTGLTLNTPYTFQILGKNSAGTAGPSITANATTSNQTVTTPTAPFNLGATPAGPGQAYLTWVNTAGNQTSFVLTRATDSNFTQNIVNQTLPAAPFYYTDASAGMSPGGTYFYKIKASNSTGSSISSNIASVTIPLVPPQPTGASAVLNGSQMVVSWTGQTGPFGFGYQIFRAIDGGAYVLYANVPDTSNGPPTTFTYTDTTIPLGHTYTYEIEGHDFSGFSTPALATGANLGSAILALDAAGNLVYTSSPGVPNRFTLQLAGGTYTLMDLAVNITVTGAGAASVTGAGTSTVTFPATAVIAMSLDTSDGTDAITIKSDDVPITIAATSGGGSPTLQLGDPSASSTINGTLTNQTSSPFNISGSGPTNINGDLINQGSGAGLIISGSGTVVIGGKVNLGNGNLTENDSGPVTINGAISGNNLTMAGSGSLTLSGNNLYTGTTAINSGSVTVLNNNALGSSIGGPVTVSSGASLLLPATGGITLPAGKGITLNGVGTAGNGALESLGGTNTINGPIGIAAGAATMGVDSGTLVLNGNITQFGNLTFVGAGNVNVNGTITGQGSAPGLLESQAPGNIFTGTQTAINLATYGFDAQLYPFMGTTEAAAGTATLNPTAQHIWANNDSWLYQGYINVPNYNNTGLGYISFAKAFDDSVRIAIDGVINPYALSSNTLNSSLGTGELTLTSGWHAIDIRLANGTGAAGANGSNTNGWTGFVAGNNTGGGNGLVYRIDNGPSDPLGNTTNNGKATNYAVPVDNGTGNLFAYAITSLVMNGTGTVSLNASSPGNDALTINSGILSATVNGALGNNFSATPLPITVNSGGTLAIQGGTIIPTYQPLYLSGSGSGGVGALEVLGGNNTINAATTLMGSATINVAANSSFTMNGNVLGGSSAFTLTKAGGGTMVLANNANTYLGPTTISGGILQIAADASLGGSPTSVITVNVATLDINLAANDQSTHGFVLGSPVSTLQVDGINNTYTIATAISGVTGTLNKTGTGILALGGGNSYASTIITQGTLQIANPQALGTGLVKMNGGQLAILGSSASQQAIPIAAGSFNQDVIWGGSEFSALPASGTTSGLDAPTGNVLYQAGAPFSPPGSGLPTSGLVFSAANPTVAFQLQPYTQNNVMLMADGNSHIMTFATPTTVQALNVLAAAPNGAATYNLTINFMDGSQDTTNFTNQVVTDWSGGAGFAIQGLGRIDRQGDFNYTGLPTSPRLYEQDFNLAAAQLGGVLDSSKPIASVVFTKVAGTTLGIFAVSGKVPSSSQIYVNPVLVAADSSIDVENQNVVMGTLSIGTNALTVSSGTANSLALGNTTLTGNPTFSVATSATLNLGSLNDGGSADTLTFNGAGVANLSAPAGSLVNGTAINVSNGTLNSNNATALGALPSVSVSGGSFLGLGASQTLGSLSGAGNVNLNGNTLTVGGSNNLPSTFTGSINDGVGTFGSGGLIKAGLGIFTLGSSSNSGYTGPTTVNAGTLLVDGSLTASPLTVNGGTLGGTGTIGAQVSATGGSNVSPGDVPGATGTITTGSLQMMQGGAFNVELGGTAPGQFDQIVVSSPGTVQLDSGSGGGLGGVTLHLSLVNGFTPVLGQHFKIIDNQGPSLVAGKFFGPIIDGGTITLNQHYIFSVSYAGGDGNDVVLTVTAVSGQADHFLVTPPQGLTAVPAGTSVNFTVTALDVNNLLAKNYTGTVTFSSATDHQALLPLPGTLTNSVGNFVGTFLTAGQETLTATDLSGPPTLTGTSNPALLVTPLNTTNFLVTTQATVFLGQPASFTVKATDLYGNLTGSAYSGTIQFSSSDATASFPSSTNLTGGTGTFNVTFDKIGNQTISVNDSISKGIQGTSGIINVSAIATKLKVISSATSIAAGVPFTVTVTAQDNLGNTATAYPGTVQISTNGGNPVLPPNATLSNGVGTFVVSLTKVAGNPWTVTATQVGNSAITGAALPVAVTPLTAAYLTVSNPGGTVITGAAFSVTVQAFDVYNNLATGYAGQIALTSNDPNIPTLVGNYPFTSADNGSHVFNNLTLTTGGNRILTATDLHATNPIITGTSTTIITRGLVVSAVTPMPNGFIVTFNKPFVPGNLFLFNANTNTTVDVQLKGSNGVRTIHGSLVIDPSNQMITFKATAAYLQELNALAHGDPNYASVVLPDSTYTITLVSGTAGNGFMDSLNLGLDGQNSGAAANYTTTFTTHFQANATTVLGLPDFARGPDSNTPIAVPASGFGIPITLYNAVNVTDVKFSLTYNSSLLSVLGALGGAGSDATDQNNGVLTLVTNSAGVATFHYAATTPFNATPDNPLVLGDIRAVVPSGAGAAALSLYQVKEQLQLGSIVINGNAGTGAVGANGLHVNAYFGDVTGDKVIDGLDKLTADNVAQAGRATGFAAFVHVDPAILGDVAADLSMDAGDVSTIDAFVAQLQPQQIPLPPTQLLPGNPNFLNKNLISSPTAADPILSLVSGNSAPLTTHHSQLTSNFAVSILLDHPHPAGSSGLTQVGLALTYDPTALLVSPADITLGSIPNQGSGWQIVSVVDQTTGQIGIELTSLTPITATQAGSLVNIAFHPLQGERRGVSPPVLSTTTVNLVDAATPNGQWFDTVLGDSQGGLMLSPGVNVVQFPTNLGYDSNRGVPLPVSTTNDPKVGEDNQHYVAPLAETKAESVPGGLVNLGQNTGDVTHTNVSFGIVTPTVSQPSTEIARYFVPAFQIGNLPLLNFFLLQNSPGELSTQNGFQTMARWMDAPCNFIPLGQSFSLLYDETTAGNDPGNAPVISTNQLTETDSNAVRDTLFAQMAEGWEDFGDLDI